MCIYVYVYISYIIYVYMYGFEGCFERNIHVHIHLSMYVYIYVPISYRSVNFLLSGECLERSTCLCIHVFTSICYIYRDEAEG